MYSRHNHDFACIHLFGFSLAGAYFVRKQVIYLV